MDNIRTHIARHLLSIGAVFLRPDDPFVWASGIKSPIYCDNRLILTAPEARNEVEQAIADTVRREYPEAQVLRLLRLSSRWTHSGRIVDRSWRCLGHVPERFWTHKKAQNRFRQFCASVFVPERFPAGAGCTFGVRTGRTLRSIVVVRPFCLRASAFPFGAAAAVSPGPVIRTLFACHP